MVIAFVSYKVPKVEITRKKNPVAMWPRNFENVADAVQIVSGICSDSSTFSQKWEERKPVLTLYVFIVLFLIIMKSVMVVPKQPAMK